MLNAVISCGGGIKRLLYADLSLLLLCKLIASTWRASGDALPKPPNAIGVPPGPE
jgi:hypothetical protein